VRGLYLLCVEWIHKILQLFTDPTTFTYTFYSTHISRSLSLCSCIEENPHIKYKALFPSSPVLVSLTLFPPWHNSALSNFCVVVPLNYCFWYIWTSYIHLTFLFFSLFRNDQHVRTHKMWAIWGWVYTWEIRRGEKNWRDGKSINENCLFQISHFSFPCCTDACYMYMKWA
jgi:hypothetical protein